ncbi:protein kinase domain-containing protein [Candidatus Uabimicrobium amorphum]|uniref:Protein kinase n=1 Tax=Uabimicrobium amorphum TaxID=2596890 RepID=A0A5S9ITG4_UABAM|nr:HEAT repeat domain-containing protein [Candidatus Uabimicrobium amorphum]BBM87250.1 protein kinase [Candidatus Uabimicrobium amorphum]
MEQFSKTNYNLAQALLQRNLVEKTLLEKALSKCNEQKLHLSQFLVQHKILSAAQMAEIFQKQTTQFGKYTVIDELARGGMGVVYRAKSTDFDRIVVLKTLLSHSDNTAVLLKRFLKEAQAVAALSHPNIVQLYDYGEQNGIPYFTMQYVPGSNFDDFIFANNDLEACIKILLKVSHALHYAHETGIVHRDMKPGNILLDKNNEPYIADFGLAKIEDKTSSLTQTGNVIGTPFYLSPEQALGHRKRITKSTDIYALGVILYQILTKQYPFEADNLSLLLRKIDTEVPIAPQKINHQVPKQLNYLCLKAISKRIEHRHATALEFAEDLQQYLEKPQKVSRRLVTFSAKVWWKNVQTKLAIAICVGIIFITGITTWQQNTQLDIGKEKLRSKTYFEIKNLIEQKKYALALSKINLFLQKDTTPQMIALKAKVYYAENAIPVARKLFREALSYQQDEELLFDASNFYYAIDEPKVALPLITKTIAMNDRRAAYYQLRAKIYNKLNESELSKKDNDTANKIEQADITAYLRKLQRLKKQQGKAIAITEEILRLYPHRVEAYRERSKIFHQRGDIVAAINDIAQAVELQPSFENYRLQAEWLQKGGYHQDALRSYYQLLNYEKKIEFYRQILQLHCDLGEYDKGIAVYNKMASKDKIFPSITFVMAKIHFHYNKLATAKKFIDRFVQEPDKEFLYLRGMIYFGLDLKNVAYESLQKLLPYIDQFAKSEQFDVLRALGDILMQKGNSYRAQKLLVKALEIHPSHAATNFLLGKCYEDLDNLQQALTLYTKSIDLEPWQQKFYHQRGNIHFKLQKWLSAHHDFLKCMELGSRSTELVSQLFNTTFNEGWTFDRMLMMNIIFGKILLLYNNTEINLLGERQQKLAKNILDTPSVKHYVDDSAKKLKIAKQFLQRLDNDSSENVKTIAANGLKALYYVPEVLDLVAQYVKKNPSSQILKTVYTNMREKQLNEAKVVLKKLLIAYFTAQDENSLLQIYNNKQKYTAVLKNLLYGKKENPVVRFYAAQVLWLMSTENAYEVLQKAATSVDNEVAMIVHVVLAKYEKRSHRMWSRRELGALPTFLRIQYIENVAQKNMELWLQDRDVYVQLYAIKKIWLAGNTAPLKRLVKFCKNKRPIIRAFALETMWKLENHTPLFREQITAKYSHLLVKAMDDANAKVRQVAILSAQKISSPQCRKKIHEKLQDPEKEVRSQAIIALATLGEFAVVAKITLNTKEDFAIRLMPFAYFEKFTSQRKVPVFSFASTLQRLTIDPDPRLRSIAIAYLMKAGGGKVAKFFISQIDLKNKANRFAVISGLGASNNSQMIPYLLDVAKNDKDIEIRKVACYSIVHILLNNNEVELEKFHQYLMQQEKEIRESASIGYTYGIYEIFYHSRKKASSITDVFDNNAYRHFLYNIEKSIAALPPTIHSIVEFRLTKAHELGQKDHQAFNKGVIQYLCGKEEQAEQTLRQCNFVDNGLYCFWMARVYFARQKYSAARQLIVKAAQRYPWDQKIIQLHAHIEKKMGNHLAYQELVARMQLIEKTVSQLDTARQIPTLFVYRRLAQKKIRKASSGKK